MTLVFIVATYLATTELAVPTAASKVALLVSGLAEASSFSGS